MEKSYSKKLSGKQVAGYLSGFIPLTLILGVFRLAYIKFFYDSLGLSLGYFVIGMVIFMFINMINDPLIGQRQDNTDVNRWGSRRIVYIKYFSPIFVVLFVFMWFPWTTDTGTELGQFILFLHFVISISTFDTLSNIVTMAWMALLPDMTSDLDERTKINFLGGIIVLFASFFIMTVPTMVDNLQFFQFYNIIVGIISFICYALIVKFSKETPEFQHDKSPPIRTALKQTMKSKPFMLYIGYNFFKTLHGSIQLSWLFTFLVLIGSENVVYYFLIAIIVGWGSNIICMKLKPKYGFKKLMLRYGTVQFLGGFVLFFLILIPAIELTTIWIGLIFSTFFAGAGIFGVILQTLPIDQDEINYGSRREGMFYGINALFTRPAESIGPIIAALILAVFGYQQNTIVQSPEAILGIKIIWYIVVNIFAGLALIFVYFYPLHGEKLKKLEIDLEELHQKKKERSSFNKDAPKRNAEK